MYTNTSMVHMGIITHHSPLYEGNDQVAMAIQTFIIPLHSFNTSNTILTLCISERPLGTASSGEPYIVLESLKDVFLRPLQFF